MKISHPIYSSEAEIKVYRDKSGKVPFWDDPFLYGGIDRPKDYQPLIHTRSIYALFNANILHQEDNIILHHLRDAICCNEDQLRRLIKRELSSQRLSKRLRFMARYGLVDKWKLRSHDNEEFLPSSPWNIGIAGFTYLKHFSSDFVANSDYLTQHGFRSVQRYVAANEIRTQLYEYQSLRGWAWHPRLEGYHSANPLAVATMKSPTEEINVCIERLQQSQPFINYIFKKLKIWKDAWEQNNNGCIPFKGIEQRKTIILLSVATDDVAKKLVDRLPFAEYPFPIWFTIDERLYEDELPESILIYGNGKLNKVSLSGVMLKREVY